MAKVCLLFRTRIVTKENLSKGLYMGWVKCNSVLEAFTRGILRQGKKMEMGYKYMTMDNIMKANGKMDANMDKDTYSSVMEAIVEDISWKTSFTAMLSTTGQDVRNIEENGLATNQKVKE